MITIATTDEQCREITTFLTKEMGPESLFLTFPRSPQDRYSLGYLVGCWDQDVLKGAAFIRPLRKEADTLIHNTNIEAGTRRDAQTWLASRTLMVELIATTRQERRQGIAAKILSVVESIAISDGCKAILAVTENDRVCSLFKKAGYLVFKPNVALALTRGKGTKPQVYGLIPPCDGTNLVLKELNNTDDFTFNVTHLYSRNSQNGDHVIRPITHNAFRLYEQ